MAFCSCFGRRKKEPKSRNEDDQSPSPSVEMSLQRQPNLSVPKDNNIFSYHELATATMNFRDKIGEGGFGPVFKGTLQKTGQAVAVKKLNDSGLQGDKEFLVEVLMLSPLRHPNLVNLIGYCAEGDLRLLVYEYMPLGSVEDHLHDRKPNKEPLDWGVRMQIALGAAIGLNFLHNEAKPPVIFRDLKSSNILLDDGFIPKLSDFGLAKSGPTGDKSHVSTRVMGTYGYCAPEYAATGQLTMKSDIYSFGVVMLELITGCRALDKQKRMLVEWAHPMLKHHRDYVKLADPLLKGQFSVDSLSKAVEIAKTCLVEDAKLRPTVKEVVRALNFLVARLTGTRQPVEGKGGQSSKKGNDENSEEKIRLLNEKTRDRERAVAEAKMWGESCRDRKRKSVQKDV